MRFRSDYYEILQIPRNAGFQDLKRAYYRRAKDCHPDRFGGSKDKEEEFKRLVEAFDVLSDPVRRCEYDRNLPRSRPFEVDAAPSVFAADAPRSIMDSHADDILEELIVGNTLPRNATLQTLMRDLETTERFCMFREAKTLYHAGNYSAALPLLEQVASWSPENILYRYYLAKTLAREGKTRKAIRHLRRAVSTGRRRTPPQQLIRIRRLLHSLEKKQRGLLRRILPSRLPPSLPPLSTDEATTRHVERLIDRLARDHKPNSPPSQNLIED